MGMGAANRDLQPAPLCTSASVSFFCQAELFLGQVVYMKTSSPQVWTAWDVASSSDLLLTSTNFRPFRTQNNDNTLPRKKKSPWAWVKLAVC